jgi:ABC-type nitrate/sulfonate/bicarbonate transport system substrate-binding protein
MTLAIRLMALGIALLVAHPAGAVEKLTLRMGVIANSARSISQLGLEIARRRGFLDRESINLEIVPLPGVQHQIAELDKGSVDVSHTATPYLVQAVLAGSDSVAIVGGLANPVFAVMAKPGIKSLADLRGRTIGLSLPVDTITIGTLKLLKQAGIGVGDFERREIVGTPPRVDCLLRGACDAVPVGQPDDLALARKGYGRLGDSLQVIPALQFNVVAARRAWAAAHADAATRYARAFVGAYRYMNDPANAADVAALIAETTGAAPDISREIVDFYFNPPRAIMPRAGEINLEGMRAVISLMVEAGELKSAPPEATRFVDLQYLRRAGAE